MIRKAICILISVLLLTLSLAGCGTPAASTTTTAAATTAAATTTEAATTAAPTTEATTAAPTTEATTAAPEPVTLNLWSSKDETQWDKDANAKFALEYPYITLKQTLHEGDAGNDFYQSVAAGNAPDACIFSPAVMDKYARDGILAPLDAYLASWDEGQYYVKTWTDGFTYSSKLYGLPTVGSTILFAYNKALFAEAGIKAPPTTWDEMMADAKLLTKPEKQQAGYGILSAEWTEWWFQYYVWQAGGDLTVQNPDNTLKLTFTDPAVIKAAEFYQQLRDAKVIQSDITMKFDKIVEAFSQGKIGMMPFATDWVSWVISMGMKYEDIGLAAFPAGPSGKKTTCGGVGCWGINGKSTQAVQDAAWKYITFLNSKANAVDRLLWLKANQGAVNPILLPRTDYTLADIGVVDPAMVKTISDIAVDTRSSEFYGKGVVGKYVDMAVQKIIADPKADPLTEFQKQQDLATKEALADFNNSVLEAK